MQKYTKEFSIMLFKRTIRFLTLVTALMAFNTGIAQSASTEWQDLGGGKARLLAHLDPITNKVSGVIEVRLEDGWSTYWRYPGSSGIPPLFNFASSVAFSSEEVAFPAPQLITQDYGSYAGYKKKVMFPFEGELLATSGAKIKLDLLIGVCSEVCIPAKAQFQIASSKLLQSDPQTVQAVSFAKITIPKIENADEVLISREQINEDVIYIKTKHKKSFGKPAMFVEGPSNWYLTPADLISQEGDTALFKLDVSRAPKGTHVFKHKLRYTIVTGTKGIEIQR